MNVNEKKLISYKSLGFKLRNNNIASLNSPSVKKNIL